MNVLISGASGLVGSELVAFLTQKGHYIKKLVRKEPKPDANEIKWDPASSEIEQAALEGLNAVVHLAGENIAGGRWTSERKALIRESRVQGTRLLSETLAKLKAPPKVLVSASAIGFYGDRGDEVLDEESESGSNFLAEVCQEWEEACEAAGKKGIRVVNLRIGVVLSAAGGALAKMLLPFKMGVGGVIGSGSQYMSWIAIDDLVGATHHALVNESLNGPVNVVAPNPATNREFTKTLGLVLKRPTIFPMPAFAARLAFGEMADELLLASTRVVSTKLNSSNFQFQFPELEGALRHVLGRVGPIS